MTKNHVLLGAGGLALVVAAGIAFSWLHLFDGTKGSKDFAKMAPVRAQVVTPQEGGVERTVTRPGTVHSFQYAQLFAKVAGYLNDQTVDIGAQVQKNQELCRIYAPEIQTNVEQAEAGVKKAKAHVEVTRAGVDSSKADLLEAQAKLEQSQADLENAVALLQLRKEQYNRIKSLAEMKALQQELVDEKREAERAAQSNELASRKAIDTAKARVSAHRAKVTAAEAELDDARAQVRVAEATLARANVFEAYTHIRAPFEGVITLRSFHQGDFIHEGAGPSVQPILTVARTDKMRVIVYVPDPDVPYTRAGEPAEVRIDSLPDKIFKGPVVRTALSENYDTRTMRTEIDLPNPDGLLTNGMFGSVTIHLGKSKRGLTIPSACLFGVEKESKRNVYVVRDGKAVQVSVLLGQDDGIRAEVLGGLKADDQVVEQHDPGLTGGVPVDMVHGTLK